MVAKRETHDSATRLLRRLSVYWPLRFRCCFGPCSAVEWRHLWIWPALGAGPAIRRARRI